jgi:hypothetical protein
MGCGKGQEELVNFADQISQLKGHNEILARYLHLVETRPEDPGEANQIGKVLEEYHADMSKVPRPRDITLKALHGRYIRAIEKAQNRIEPPGDPMFSLEARRAIMGLQSEVETIYETLRQLLQKENLGGQYTFEWPTTGE